MKFKPLADMSKEEYKFTINCILGTVLMFPILVILLLLNTMNDDKVSKNENTTISIPHQEKYSVNINESKRKYLDHLFNTKQ